MAPRPLDGQLSSLTPPSASRGRSRQQDGAASRTPEPAWPSTPRCPRGTVEGRRLSGAGTGAWAGGGPGPTGGRAGPEAAPGRPSLATLPHPREGCPQGHRHRRAPGPQGGVLDKEPDGDDVPLPDATTCSTCPFFSENQAQRGPSAWWGSHRPRVCGQRVGGLPLPRPHPGPPHAGSELCSLGLPARA